MRRREWGWRLLCVASIAGASWTYVGPSSADDTFIYMRYVDNLLAGRGLTFNPGEASYGFTSAIWTLGMSGPALVFGNTVAVWKAASWACFTAAAALLATLFIGSTPPWRVVALVVAVCLEPHLLRWSATGMENSLVALAVVVLFASWTEILRGRGSGAVFGLLAGLTPFVRPELGMLSGLIFAEWLHQRRRGSHCPHPRAAMLWAASAAVIAAVVLWVMTGSALPQTGVAKATTAIQTDPAYGLRRSILILLTGTAGLLPVFIALWRPIESRRVVRPAAFMTLLLVAYLAWRNHLVTTRYATSLGFPILVSVLMASRVVGLPRFATLAVVGQLALTGAVLGYTYPGTRTDEGQQLAEFGLRTRDLTSRDSRIAASEIGALGLFADRHIIDLVGLVDRETLEWVGRNGRIRDQAGLERFLTDRRATHYVDPYAGVLPIRGVTVRLVPLLERPVTRNNATAWHTGRWRLYRVEPLQGGAPEP